VILTMVHMEDPCHAASSSGIAPSTATALSMATSLQFLHQSCEGRNLGKERDGTIPGLANLGNTCFMNAVLQCLLNMPGRLNEACKAFADLTPLDLSGKGKLGQRFAELVVEYDSKEDTGVSRDSDALVNIKATMAALDLMYAGCEQQDAYEFLGRLLDGLDENFGRLLRDVAKQAGPDGGMVRSICGITTYSTRWCHTCLEVFEVDRTTDTTMRLPLISSAAQMDSSLRRKEESDPISLIELLQAVQLPEEIEGYDCDRCRAISSKCGTEFHRSNMSQMAGLIAGTKDVLGIALFRFLNVLDEGGNFSPVKIRRQVKIPTVLSLETGEYRLCGIVSHMGATLSSGHYIAAVRSLRDHQWYDCDDAHVKPLNLRSLYEVGELTGTRPNADPFMLFYHRFSADMEIAD